MCTYPPRLSAFCSATTYLALLASASIPQRTGWKRMCATSLTTLSDLSPTLCGCATTHSHTDACNAHTPSSLRRRFARFATSLPTRSQPGTYPFPRFPAKLTVATPFHTCLCCAMSWHSLTHSCAPPHSPPRCRSQFTGPSGEAVDVGARQHRV